MVALAVIGLHGRLPDPRDILTVLAGADWGWILLAAFLQTVSLVAFAYQQRRILVAMGVPMGRRDALGITLASTAISIALPAGAVASTGYSIREYERAGATRELSAAAAVVSGLTAIGGLSLLYLADAIAILVNSSNTFLDWQPLAIVGALAALTAIAVTAGRRLARRPSGAWVARSRELEGRAIRLLRRLLVLARDSWRAGAALRIRDWASALAYAVVNWVADIACFAATAKAFDLRVSLATLAAIYLAVQIVRQVPLTPGGAGIVDTAFIAGLTAAGATAVSATAAVLAYRLLSTWLLIPVGGAAAVLRRYAIARAAAAGPRSAQARADRGAGRPESVSVS
ncbi:membrane protein [Phytohabitans flavus]|uniref:Membrane protein n=1 Tax=Phytohabitans flavus TaxID=1076124 RepID=A0A6F8XPA4_9ACTN|nr:membrane protein [Phytohabitans flavus]